MNAIKALSAVVLDRTVCQEDLAEVFRIVAEQIKSGDITDYTVVSEKNSGSQILYDVRERCSMNPVALLANNRVSALPPPLDPKSLEAGIRLIELDAKLRAIAAKAVMSDFTPA